MRGKNRFPATVPSAALVCLPSAVSLYPRCRASGCDDGEREWLHADASDLSPLGVWEGPEGGAPISPQWLRRRRVTDGVRGVNALAMAGAVAALRAVPVTGRVASAHAGAVQGRGRWGRAGMSAISGQARLFSRRVSRAVLAAAPWAGW